MSSLVPLLVASTWAAPDTANLDRVLQQAATNGELIAAVRVVDGDEVLLDAVYGDAPTQPVCRIGSVSKSITAAAVYALADEGKLSLSDPIGDHLPRVHDRIGSGPTLRQLATHHGGLSEPAANPWMPSPTWEEQAAVMLPQLHEEVPPGTRFLYSNFGYTLLSATVSTVSGTSLEAYAQQAFFQPLGMTDTGIAANPARDARLIPGSIPSPLGLLGAQEALPRMMAHDFRWPMGGAGAFTSSPRDLVRWAEALRDGDVLSTDARRALLTPEGDRDYAAGRKVESGRVWHNGTLEPLGVYSYVRWSQQDDVVVAFCGVPGAFSVKPEWRAVIEDALAGEAVQPPVVDGGPLGVVAALSALWVQHRLDTPRTAQRGTRGGRPRAARVRPHPRRFGPGGGSGRGGHHPATAAGGTGRGRGASSAHRREHLLWHRRHHGSAGGLFSARGERLDARGGRVGRAAPNSGGLSRPRPLH